MEQTSENPFRISKEYDFCGFLSPKHEFHISIDKDLKAECHFSYSNYIHHGLYHHEQKIMYI